MSTPPPSEPKRPKTFLGLKWWVWLIIGVIVVTALGNALRGTNRPDPTPTPTSTPAAETPTPTPTPTEPAERNTTDAGLTGASAQAACTMYGGRQFTYGWDPHWVMGKLGETVDAESWWFKIEADITNEYGTDGSFNVECRVAGPNESPTVTEFLFY